MTTGAEWIERYVHAVGRLLPAKERETVAMELRFLIQEELDPGDVEFADEGEVLDVLRHLGRPETVAARYRAPRYLIGPALFPVFQGVLGIYLAVTLALALFSVVVSSTVARQPLDLLREVGAVGGSLLQSVGLLVLIFGLIEFITQGEEPRQAKAWNPRTLPPVKDEDQVRTGQMIADIGFTVAAILIFNFFADWLSIYSFAGGQWTRTPLLTPALLAFVPWLTALWICEAALKTYVLGRGRWSLATRLLELLLSVLGIGVLLWMLRGGALAAIPALETPFRMVLALVLVVTAIDTLAQLFRLVGRYWNGAGKAGVDRDRQPSSH